MDDGQDDASLALIVSREIIMQETPNGEVAVLLRDLIDFLESLGELYLTDSLQDSRDDLIKRARSSLERRSVESPEPYLDMNAGSKSQIKSTDEIDRPEEYVNAEEKQGGQRGSLQHYYETFQDFQGNDKKKEDGKTDRSKEIDDVTLLYAGFSATQAKARSAKSSSLLHLRREWKIFLPNKQCWVSLVGTHLLLFEKEHDNRPYLVQPLEGYKGRPAPGAFPRRSEAAFEICCPGEPTLQFVAKNAQEMKEWIDAITDCLEIVNGVKVKRAPTFMEILELESTERKCIETVKEKKEKFLEALSYPKPKVKETITPTKPVVKTVTPDKEKVESPKEDAPPLPSRTRRLPSLPSEEGLPYEPREELYEEEGLYHRIEDVKAQRQYQNFQVKPKAKQEADDLPQETYDDVETFVAKSKGSNNDGPTETYDDVRNVVQSKEEPISYDDVQIANDNWYVKAEKDKSLKSPKSLIKSSISLLERVRNPRSARKDSFKKEEKKPKSPTPVATSPKSSTATEAELPCYDDVSSLTTREVVDEENYLTPPPPRPIYSRPPSTIKCAVPEEIYDDIGYGSETNGGCKGCVNVDVIRDYPKNGSFLSDLQLSIETQHYQVPKSGNRRVVEQPEEIYDDVELSRSFKSRSRDATAGPEKRVWKSFGSGKMTRIFDHVTRQNSCS